MSKYLRSTLFRFRFALLILVATRLVQCSTKSDNLLNYLNSIYKNKLDVRTLIGENRPVIGFTIKNDTALLKVTTPPGKEPDSTFFIIIDIPAKKIINTIKSPYEPYYAVCADIKGDSLFFFAHYEAKYNQIISIKTKQAREFIITDSCISIASDIIAFDKFILHTGSLYGSSAANLSTGRTIVFKNEFVSNQIAISLPLSSTINLITGRKKVFGNDSISLIAFDQTASELWNYKIKILGEHQSNVDLIKIFRTGETFIIRNSSQLLALDAASGKVRWNKTFLPYTTHAFLWNKKILLYTLQSKGSEDNLNNLKVTLIDPATGNVIWSNEYPIAGYVNMASIENDLFISSSKSIMVLNDKGKLKYNTTRKEYSPGIEWKMDESTGRNYLLYDSKVLYW